MNTTITTPNRSLYVGNLELPEAVPHLMPGDTVHIEATLTVRSVENGLDYRDRPTETVTARPAPGDGPQVVIRTATLVVGEVSALEEVTEEGRQHTPTLRERIASFKARNRATLDVLYFMAHLTLYIVAICALVVTLTGCNMVGYAKAGEPCTTIGDSNVTKSGAPLLCKPPTKSNADMGDTVNRWRKA